MPGMLIFLNYCPYRHLSHPQWLLPIRLISSAIFFSNVPIYFFALVMDSVRWWKKIVAQVLLVARVVGGKRVVEHVLGFVALALGARAVFFVNPQGQAQARPWANE